MKRKMTLLLLTAVTIGTTLSAHSVEQAQESIRIWADSTEPRPQVGNLLSLDIDPGVAGLETLGGASKYTTSAPDASNKVSMTFTYRLVARTVDGNTIIFRTATPYTMTSTKYPDPNDPQFQCNGVHQTNYQTEEDFLGCPSPVGACPPGAKCFDPAEIRDELIDEQNYNIGIANAGGQRVLVASGGIHGSYFNNVDGYVDLNVYSLTVYNMAGAKLWAKSWVDEESSGYELDPELSGIASFHAAGTDQLRVGATKEGSTSDSFRYQYYDILTGALVSQASFTVVKP